MRTLKAALCSLLLFPGACDSNSSHHSTPVAPEKPGINEEESSGNPDLPVTDPDSESGGLTGGESENPPTSEEHVPSLPPGLTQVRSAYLTNVGDAIARKADLFKAASANLLSTAHSYCAAPAQGNPELLKAEWANVLLKWQEFELLQIGPIAAKEKSLKTSIYGWPIPSSTCKIDEESLNALRNVPYTLPTQSNKKGLQAAEYLIYESTLASSCSRTGSGAAINAEWNALSGEQKVQARCAYLEAVLGELKDNAALLSLVWGPVGANYLSQVIGQADAEQAAVQSIFENLFYMDLEFKNKKLAAPAGHEKRECGKTPSPCLEKEELRLSGLSRQAMEVNINTFNDLIFGFPDGNGDRLGGMSGMVRAQGAGELADRSERDSLALQILNKAPSASLPDLIRQQQSENCELSQTSLLCSLRASVKRMASDLKDEYTKVLGVTVPAAPQGDSD